MGVPRPLTIMPAGTSDFGIRPLTNCECSARAIATQYPFWMRRFQFAADFVRGHALLGGRRVSMAEIDSLYHSRASARRAEDSAGVSREFGNGAMALSDRGYDSREGWVNLVGSADFATATVGVLGSGGSLPGWAVSAPATAGLTTEVVELLTYKGYPAARVRVYGVWNGTFWELRPGEQQGLTEGLTYTSSMVIAERQSPGAAAPQLEVSWRSAPTSAFVSGILVSTPSQFTNPATPDLQSASLVCPAGASRARLRLISGGSSGWVAGNFIDFSCVLAAPQVTATPHLMPFGSGTVAPDKLIIPASDAGLAVNPLNDNKTLVMVWRGRDFSAATPYPRMAEMQANTQNRLSLWRGTSSNNVTATYGSGGSYPGPNMATLTQHPRGTDLSIVVVWRPDGSSWGKTGAQQPIVSGAHPMLIGTLTSLGVGIGGGGGDFSNTQTLLVGFGAFDNFSDADALVLFNQVAAA